MDAIALSRNGIPVRLTDERWQHIIIRHQDLGDKQSEVLATVSNPTRIVAGDEGEFLAIRELKSQKWLVVAYRELADDGFIITAYSTRKPDCLTEVVETLAVLGFARIEAE